MSGGAIARPLPLRVRVTDVTVRASLVASERRRSVRDALNPGLVVVQRPVRIISDPPPSMIAAENDQHDGLMARQLRATVEDRYGDQLELDADELENGALDDEYDAEADAALDQLAAADARPSREASLPPPAPPEARRVPSSNPPPREPVPEPSTGRASGPFEELDVEFEGRITPPVEPPPAHVALRVSSPPVPPAPRLPSISVIPAMHSEPEPSEFGALTRAPRVQDLRPTKPRTHAWWELFFDDDYLRTVRPPTRAQIARQCDFIEKRLGLKPGASVLDVGCGLGLQVLELTARGYAAVGLDLSLAMLSRASEEAQARSLRVNLLHADMRELGFEGSFDAVTCLGTSLGYFDDETNKRVIERLCRALKPGGVLLLDVVNRDHVVRSQPNLIWFEGEGCVCMEESDFNYFTSRLQIKRTVILDTGKQIETEYALRLYALHELGQLMNAAGFRVAEVSGREAVPGVFFGHESPNLLIVAERRPNEPAPPTPPTPPTDP